jgi:hypothetical protein
MHSYERIKKTVVPSLQDCAIKEIYMQKKHMFTGLLALMPTSGDGRPGPITQDISAAGLQAVLNAGFKFQGGLK